MFRSSYSLVALCVGLGAGFGCSAQGDQADTGLDNGGNGNSSNGGAGAVVGGTNGTGATGNGGTGVIPPSGGTSGSAGAAGSGGTQGGILCEGQGTRLKGRLRDFQPTTNPDFEPQMTKPGAINYFNAVERGIVRSTVDPVAWLPIYAGPATGTNTTIGPASFASWFVDVAGVNLAIDYWLDFVDPERDGIYTFDQAPFLPIDDPTATKPNSCPMGALQPNNKCLLGNSTNYATHNYAMTFELHTNFVFHPGMVFSFSGDDDVWVFVNNQLVIDLGGIHMRETGAVNLDGGGLTDGQTYRLDFFWAERHVSASNFHIDTSLAFQDCGIEPVR